MNIKSLGEYGNIGGSIKLALLFCFEKIQQGKM